MSIQRAQKYHEVLTNISRSYKQQNIVVYKQENILWVTNNRIFQMTLLNWNKCTYSPFSPPILTSNFEVCVKMFMCQQGLR